MGKDVYELMAEILEVKEREKELMKELRRKLGSDNECNVVSPSKQIISSKPITKLEARTSSPYSFSNESLDAMNLSDEAKDILNKNGIKYFYDIEDGVEMSKIKSWTGNNFKAFNEIVIEFKDWGVPVFADIEACSNVINEKLAQREKQANVADDPKYKTKPYTIKIKDIDGISVLARNTLVRAGYKTVYDVFMTPKKKLLKNVKRFGIHSYDEVRNYFETNYQLTMEPTRKRVKIKDAIG